MKSLILQINNIVEQMNNHGIGLELQGYRLNFFCDEDEIISKIKNYISDEINYSIVNENCICIYDIVNGGLFENICQIYSEIDYSTPVQLCDGTKLYKCVQDIGSKDIELFYIFNTEKKYIASIINENHLEHEILSMRIIRSVYKYMLIKDDWVPFHAAAFSQNDKGIAIVGDKYAGKTYMLFSLLEKGDFDFISNDKIYLKEIDGKINILTLFNKVGIRYGTIPKLYKLIRYFRDNNTYYNNRNIDEILNEIMLLDEEVLKKNINKIFLLPKEVRNIYGLENKMNYKLTAVVIPTYNLCKTKIMDDKYLYNLYKNQFIDISKEFDNWLANYFNIDNDRYLKNFNLFVKNILCELPQTEYSYNKNSYKELEEWLKVI